MEQNKLVAVCKHLDKQLAHELRVKLVEWMQDGQNDCLRARGDRRWQAAVTLEAHLYARVEELI